MNGVDVCETVVDLYTHCMCVCVDVWIKKCMDNNVYIYVTRRLHVYKMILNCNSYKPRLETHRILREKTQKLKGRDLSEECELGAPHRFHPVRYPVYHSL